MLGGYAFPVASRIFFGPAPTQGSRRPASQHALRPRLGRNRAWGGPIRRWLFAVFGFFRTALLSAMVSLAPRPQPC